MITSSSNLMLLPSRIISSHPFPFLLIPFPTSKIYVHASFSHSLSSTCVRSQTNEYFFVRDNLLNCIHLTLQAGCLVGYLVQAIPRSENSRWILCVRVCVSVEESSEWANWEVLGERIRVSFCGSISNSSLTLPPPQLLSPSKRVFACLLSAIWPDWSESRSSSCA